VPPPVPWLPPPVGLGVGAGVAVGVGVGVAQPRRWWWQGAGVAVGVGVGVGVGAAAATPDIPASMSAKTPGSSARAARPLGRRRGVSSPMTFALIDVIQLSS
jgi:hypothetical protein